MASRSSFWVVLFAIASTWTGLVALIGGQRADKTVWSGVYTAAQARRGEQVYRESCSYCHRDDLTGGFLDDGVGRAPALAGHRAFGSSFFERWEDATVRDLAAAIAATMPQQKPASLSVQAYIDVVSFLLEKNGMPAGDSELPTDVEALGQILIVPSK